MTEYGYETTEAFNTSLKLASMVGRLRVTSNLQAVREAQQKAFEEAGRACALIVDASTREGGYQAPVYRDARGALAQCRAWIHIVAELINEPASAFSDELEVAEQATKQVSASLRVLDMRRDSSRERGAGPPRGGGGRGPGGPGGPPGGRGPGGPGGPGGGPRGGGRDSGPPRGPRGGDR